MAKLRNTLMNTRSYDAYMIGSGIMSSTLATMLHILHPDWKIGMVEKEWNGYTESSHSKHNAGTGHAGYCELNYTPITNEGNIYISKAVETNRAFQKSLDFWQYLINNNAIQSDFIHEVPHVSFVEGEDDVDFLERRYKILSKHAYFSDMEFSKDINEISEWIPLVMKDRDVAIPVAATRVKKGKDIEFGKLTNYLHEHLYVSYVDLEYACTVEDIYRDEYSTKWIIIYYDHFNKRYCKIVTKFLFIGAGGASLPLLQKTEIPEANIYAGFPVSGQFLITDNPEIVAKHEAKVYGRPSLGAPPMSTPHLDMRIIDGKKYLMFGPYAGFSTKFLKTGSFLDFFLSINTKNIKTLLSAGIRNIPLAKYLISELFKCTRGRFKILKHYYPDANIKDWKKLIAGQRVQVIKNVWGKGVIEFGTEIVSSEDGSIATILGASPGASTSTHIMLDLIDLCFKDDSKENLLEIIKNGK